MEARSGVLKRWRVFVMERFPPVTHVPLITFYVSANAAVAYATTGREAVLSRGAIVGWMLIVLVFFHLRLFDEVKDYEKDLLVHPERPLPRGLIGAREVRTVAALLITAECVLGLLMGLSVLVAVCCVIVYSLLMFREFFVGGWLRSRLIMYALTHTIISCWMALVVFSAVTRLYLWEVPEDFALFLVANILIFNIYEFGRKTFGREEERAGVESYSRLLGPAGAAASVFVMASAAAAVAIKLGSSYGAGWGFILAVGALLGLTMVSCVLYGAFNNARWAKVFRGISSLFILLFTVIMTTGFLLRGNALP